MNEFDLLRCIAEMLAKGRIDYMLTGSMALNYYAQPRMTRDLDIVIELKGITVSKLVSIFKEEFYISQIAVKNAFDDGSIFNVIHLESLIKVDFIPRKNTPYRRVEFDNRKRIQLENFSAWIVSKEDLILSKLEWMKDTKSELQKRDIEILAATGYDSAYLNLWTKKLNLEDVWEDITNE